jgi:hypothetical protein
MDTHTAARKQDGELEIQTHVIHLHLPLPQSKFDTAYESASAEFGGLTQRKRSLCPIHRLSPTCHTLAIRRTSSSVSVYCGSGSPNLSSDQPATGGAAMAYHVVEVAAYGK